MYRHWSNWAVVLFFAVILIGACASGNGAARGVSDPARETGADFLRFLKRVVCRYRGRELRVGLDNSSTQSMPAVQMWLTDHPARASAVVTRR